MSFDPLPAAQEVLRIRRERRILERLDPAIAPSSTAEGVAVQHALARLVGAEQPAGFKIGATGRRMQAYLGISEPIAGFMRADDVHDQQAELRFADYVNPGAECEVAVRLARDLPPGPCSLDDALAAVGTFFAAIELVENRYGDLKDVGTPVLTADQMYHTAAVIGDPGAIDWRGLEIGALRGRIMVRDGASDEGTTTDLLGHPLNGLAWLAGSALAAAFGGLKADQVIMLGSVTPPVWLTGPAQVTVAFPPLPPVALRLV
jgi:2-keto-4-pentenoate hydratase